MSRRVRSIFALAAVNVGILVLLEAGARVLATIRDDLNRASAPTAAEAPWYRYSPLVGWEPQPGYSGPAAGTHTRTFASNGLLAQDARQVAESTAHHKRVVFIGDSNTMGFGNEASNTFAEVVDTLLEGVDAINLGVSGYTSYQGRVVLDRALPTLKPDLVVVSFNFNDRRFVLSPAESDGADQFRRLAAAASSRGGHLADWLSALYLVRGVKGLLTHAGLLHQPPSELRLDSLAVRVSPDSYRDNLLAMAASARRAGVPIVFVLLGDSPIQTYHIREGIVRFDAADYRGALQHFEEAARQTRGMFWALGRRYLSRTYAALGDSAAASRALWISAPSPSLHGQAPLWLDSDYQAIMKAVAGEQGIPLVDGVTIQRQHPEDFFDFCHFDSVGHRRIGEAIARTLELMLAPATRPGNGRVPGTVGAAPGGGAGRRHPASA